MIERKNNSNGDIVIELAEIMEIKRITEEMQKSINDKEKLIKEIYHRVKNNLQVITSLLSLQSQSIRDDILINAFRDSLYRVKAIALVHEKLYQSKNLTMFDFSEYIKDLVKNIIEDRNIDFQYNIDDIYLDVDTAMPCGLIIDEIVTNSIKYAFINNDNSKINIVFKQIEDNKIELIVGDNGIGLIKDFNINNATTLGLKLISILTKQLHGELSVTNENGLSYKLIFPRDRN